MRVSIISAYYKRPDLIERFLNNLKDKITIDDEIIIVNAGNSVKIESDIANYKRVDLEENKSFSNSMNSGVAVSTGDYIVIIGSDGFPNNNDWLDKLISYQQEHNSAITCPVPSNPNIKAYDHLLVRGDNYKMFPAICWLLPRKVWDGVGTFDERFLGGTYEDDDYCKRVVNNGGSIMVCRDVTITHLLSQEVNNFNVGEMMSRNKKLYEEKWK